MVSSSYLTMALQLASLGYPSHPGTRFPLLTLLPAEHVDVWPHLGILQSWLGVYCPIKRHTLPQRDSYSRDEPLERDQ